MKRIVKIMNILLVFVFVLSSKSVYADSYKMMELIPKDKKVTIRGDQLLYKDIEIKEGNIVIGQIKNITDEKKSITISIGLFGSDRRNITIVNYCSTEDALETNGVTENYQIPIDEDKFDKDKTLGDVKYYAIIGENKSCRLGGAKEYVGEKISRINRLGNNALPSSVTMLLNIVKYFIIGFVILFLYKFLFTGAYRNVDGEDMRADFAYINKQKEIGRERERKLHPKKPKTIKQTKSDKVLAQEKKESAHENKDDSNLHNFYK